MSPPGKPSCTPHARVRSLRERDFLIDNLLKEFFIENLLDFFVQNPLERDFFIANLLLRIHCVTEMIQWVGHVPWSPAARTGVPHPEDPPPHRTLQKPYT